MIYVLLVIFVLYIIVTKVLPYFAKRALGNMIQQMQNGQQQGQHRHQHAQNTPPPPPRSKPSQPKKGDYIEYEEVS